MYFCKTQAVALKKGDYSNSSQIVAFYTRDYGKVRALAKGSKRIEKKSRGPVDLFSYMEIIFIQKESTGLHLLTEWESLRDFPAFRKDVERFYAACHVVQLACELTEEGDSNEPLFDLILETLQRLSLTRYTEVVLRAFELQALKLLGYLPQLEECVDRKSTRLNSSHSSISYAVFCLKKKKNMSARTSTAPPAPYRSPPKTARLWT